MQKKYVHGKPRGRNNKKFKWRYEKGAKSSKKRIPYNNKEKENNSTIEKNFDKYGNKFSIYDTVKEVDVETITSTNIVSLTGDNTTSLQYDDVEDIGKINN